MKTAAIIAEYNPFHAGHAYHIEQTRKKTQCDVLVVILSSFFSQRGLPSLLTTEQKTRMALAYGADLVIELPAVYAAQSADHFARYAIESLSSLHVDEICFGSERADIQFLEDMAENLETMQADPSTSLARNFQAHAGHLQPNDILGLQYILHMKPYGIQPVVIERNQKYKSATQTRADFFAGKTGQFEEQAFLKEQNWNSYYPYLRLNLRLSNPKELERFFLVEEGIQYRLIEAARTCENWDSFLQACISKTYTRARIQRTCLFILLQITKEMMAANHSFHDILVLGMNEKGKALLRSVKEEGHIKTRFKDLSPFLQTVYIKCKTLYDSVLEQPTAFWKVQGAV